MDKIELMYSRSAYGHDKAHVSKVKNDEFKYPVVYGNPLYGTTFMYSNTKDNGHFGVAKLILVGASKSSILDLEGEYGMTEYAHGIIDTRDNLIKIQEVFNNQDFQMIMSSFVGRMDKAVLVPNLSNAKILNEFRKDFWKDFI